MNDVQRLIKYMEENNLPEAQELFEKVKKESSDHDLYWLASRLSQYGFLEEAADLYERLISAYPEEGELRVLLSELLMEMGREEEAYRHLEALDTSDPDYPRALLLQADLYQMQGLFEVSEQKLLLAKNILPEEPVIDYALGELYMSLGRFLEAIKCFERLLKAGEKEMAGQNVNARMAEALSAGGAFEDSLPYYEKALEDRLEINVLFGYGLTAFQAGQYTRAKKAFNELKEIDPDYHTLYMYLAKCHEHEEQADKALEVAKEGLEHDEFNKELYEMAGILALKTGKEEEAESFLRQALALDPEYIEAALKLDQLLIRQERYADVLEIALGFIDNGMDDPRFRWHAALGHHAAGQYSQALNEYRLAYNELNSNRDFLKDYGYFLIEEGQREEAAGIFGKLASLEPDNVEWMDTVERLLEE